MTDWISDFSYLTTKQMSEKWSISKRRIALLCAEGRIPGVLKVGKTWLIPRYIMKPRDLRKVINK